MNDFTKEELEYLNSSLHWATGNPMAAINYDKYSKLSKKLDSMIDNYCEHEFIINTNSPYIFMMCSKCDKIYVDDTFPG